MSGNVKAAISVASISKDAYTHRYKASEYARINEWFKLSRADVDSLHQNVAEYMKAPSQRGVSAVPVETPAL